MSTPEVTKPVNDKPQPIPVVEKVEQRMEKARNDLKALFEKFRLPGIDTQKLMGSYRKDIEALLSANERAFAALEALSRKQTDLFTEVVKEWQAGTKEVIAKEGGAEKVNLVAAHAQKAFVNAIAAMKDMAEIAAKSTQDVVSILNKRYHEGIEELRSSIRVKQ